MSVNAIELNNIPHLDIEFAPHDPAVDESAVHHPIIVTLAIIAVGIAS